jgi:LmbE family N-acetylglucosaminyl deacetylase
MVMAPHPDDESLAAGGLIQRALAYAVPVSVVFATDGENNPWPQRLLERRVRIGPCQREAWGMRRRKEADAALRALGAGRVRVYRLGWPDGGLTAKLLDDSVSALTVIRQLVTQDRPTILVLPDLADRHPDHSALHVLMEIALAGLPGVAPPHCLGYLLHGPPCPRAPRTAVFSLTAAERARKRSAIEANASQMPLRRAPLLRFVRAEETFVSALAGCAGGSDGILPWAPRWPLRYRLALLAVDGVGGERVRLAARADANLFWRDGSPAARASRPLQPPYYVKLYSVSRSPWIFDRWGWFRFSA